MSGIHLSMNAWNEILARTMDAFDVQHNVSPDWLINPSTRRRLKLDRYYPDAGIAIRFAGLTAKGQKRQSDWEVMESQQRDQTREELCKQNGVFLAVVDPADDPIKQVDNVVTSLRRAKTRAETQNKKTYRKLERAMLRAKEVRSLIFRNPEQMMATLAEGWRDRETRLVDELNHAASTNGTAAKKRGRKVNLAKLRAGDQIQHERFGAGEVIEISGDGEDATLSIQFGVDDQGAPLKRTFLASLVADKLKKV